MKRIITTIAALLLLHIAVVAQNIAGVTIDNLSMKRSGEYMTIKMDIDLHSLSVKADRATVITPMLVSTTDSIALEAMALYGRNRYYQYIRNNTPLVADGKGNNYRASEAPRAIDYSVVVPYQAWMDGAYLKVERKEYGCCHKLLARESIGIGLYKELVFSPLYVYVRPCPRK